MKPAPLDAIAHRPELDDLAVCLFGVTEEHASVACCDQNRDFFCLAHFYFPFFALIFRIRSRPQRRHMRMPRGLSRYVFDTVYSCPAGQCVLAAFAAAGVSPRSVFSRGVT